MSVAVLILTWNAVDASLECLKSVTRQSLAPDHILVVDNASQDTTVEHICSQFPDVQVLRNVQNLGFAVGMNVGIKALQELATPPDIVVLLNQDTQVAPEWLQAISAPFAEDAQIGAVGCKLRYPDGTLQHAGAFLEWPRAIAQHVGWHERDTGQYDQRQEYETMTGAALALRMAALQEVGLFDPGFSPAYYEDTDLCWRLRRHGYRIVYEPQAVVTHHESSSIPDAVTRSRYYNRGRLCFVLKTYTFEDIIGPFAASEQAFIHEHGYSQEARALRWAYVETLVHLPEILTARQSFYPALLTNEKAQIAAMLMSFKQALTASLYQRTLILSDAIRSV